MQGFASPSFFVFQKDRNGQFLTGVLHVSFTPQLVPASMSFLVDWL